MLLHKLASLNNLCESAGFIALEKFKVFGYSSLGIDWFRFSVNNGHSSI